MDKLVSVIMPVYNAERFLDWALQSIIGQIYKNWEIVAVNDCSTDSSYQILERYAKTYPDKIHIYSNEKNRGVAYTLNKAISYTVGEYICWLSADDMYLDTMLSSSLQYIEEHSNCDAVFSKFAIIDENNNVFDYCGDEMYADCKDDNSIKLYKTLLTTCNFFNGCSLFGKREAFQKTGKFDEKYGYAQDYQYWIRFAAMNRIGYVDEYNVLNRHHPGQGTCEGRNDIDAIHAFADLTDDENIMRPLCHKSGMEYDMSSISWCFINRIIFYYNLGMQNELREVTSLYSEWLNKVQSKGEKV